MNKIIWDLSKALELYAQGLFCAVTFGTGSDVPRRYVTASISQCTMLILSHLSSRK